MKFEAVCVNSAPEVLVRKIVARITSGELKPGVCLPSQRELARMFHVGLGSVREAIKILDVMGYIRVVRGKGTFIADNALNPAHQTSRVDSAFEAVSLSDLMKAREMVECGAARLAAAGADEDGIARLKDISRRMEKSFSDTATFYELDFSFHLAVAEATNNRAIYEIVKLLVDRAHNHIAFMHTSLSISMSFNVEKAVETARQIVAYIEAGDGASAGQMMQRHLNIVNDELENELESYELFSPSSQTRRFNHHRDAERWAECCGAAVRKGE